MNGKKRESQREWRSRNREKVLEYAKKYRDEHKKECREYYRKHKEERRIKSKIYRDINKERIRKDGKRYYDENKVKTLGKRKGRKAEAKLLVLTHYSSGIPKCLCCGETGLKFLTINHNAGDGAAHRRSLGGGASAVYLWLARNNFPEGFSVLCYNCNCASWYNNGICPHKENKGEIDVNYAK